MSDTALEFAFRPAKPGSAVRSLGVLLPGARRTGSQIRRYAAGWRTDALAVLGTDQPALVVFGDSLGQGIGAADRSGSYAALVSTELAPHLGTAPPVFNLSRSGARIEDVLEVQIPAYRAACDRGLSVIGGVCTVGSNDLIRSARLGRTKQRVTRLVEELPEGVVVATVPDRGSQVAKRLNRHLRQESRRATRPVADIADALTSWKGRMAGDGFHPNDAGYRLWADVIAGTLIEARPASRPGPM